MTAFSVTDFVRLLEDAGVAQPQRHRLHALFEARFPEAHQRFLEHLGVPAAEVARIRADARGPWAT